MPRPAAELPRLRVEVITTDYRVVTTSTQPLSAGAQGSTDTPPVGILKDMTETAVTPETFALRRLLDGRRDEFRILLAKYAATNPQLFGSVARGTAHEGSDIDIVVEMDPADGNLLMRASGLMEETRALFGRDDIDIFPAQLLKRPISASALQEAVAL